MTKKSTRKPQQKKPRGGTEMDSVIGNHIRQRRLEMNVSQSELAGQIGVSFQQVQKYEKGTNRVAVSRLHQIAAALQTEPLRLMGDNGKGKVHTVSKLAEFLATKDGVDINEAVLKLGEQNRRAVLSLARALGRQE